MKYLIIGAGIVGLATAHELLRRGERVTLLERGVVGREASWAGGGILSPLLPWDYVAAVTALARWSAQLYPDWTAALQRASGVDPEYQRSGLLVLSPPASDAADLWCTGHGVALKRLEAREIAPHIAPKLPEAIPALWLPEVAQVRNPRLLQALRRSVLDAGGVVIEQAEVTGWQCDHQQITAVTTPRGDYTADAYIVAAGAWSGELLSGITAQPDIRPVRGQMLLFKVASGSSPLNTILLQHGFYLIPRRDGHILAGSTMETAGFDKTATAAARDDLLAKAQALLPGLTADKLVAHWAGLRPGTPHNIPVIARHPRISNLYLNSGHHRYGVTMAPASAVLLANILQQRPQPLEMSAYDWK